MSGRLWFWQQDDFGIDEVTHGDEARIAIHNEVTGVFQVPVFAIRKTAAALFHSRGIEARRDPGSRKIA